MLWKRLQNLGLHIDEFLNLNTNSEHIANSASRALGGVISKFRSLKNVSIHTYKTLYNSSVLSVLNYSSEIWGFYKSKHCDKIHLRAIRYFLGVHKFCPTPAILGDIGWYPHNIIRQINMIRFWNRLIEIQPIICKITVLNFKTWLFRELECYKLI